jgi:hypothetical protein
MKVTIENLQDTFKIGYEAFEDSREEALQVMDLYHNRHYTDSQLATLNLRGQPKETFNIVKLFTRMLIGYYSTVVNTVKVAPKHTEDTTTAAILDDLTSYVYDTNNYTSEGDKLKQDLLLTGLMVGYADVEELKEVDEFGRPKYKINISHVPSMEVVLDPMSMLDDYSDARFIHRYKWISEDAFVAKFGAKMLKDVESYHNHLNVNDAEYDYTFNTRAVGKYKVHDNYLVVHSIMHDENDTYSVFWCADVILDKKKITYKEVKNPYRVQKLHNSNRVEHYGIFREIIETQHAINQALLKIQLMVNTQKAFVEEGAVSNLEEFSNQFNRVNAIIPVKRLAGIRVENLTREVLDQYTIIDKALDRVQRILSINDSFMGMAYASDSGSKVKLQQNASMVALRYATAKVEQFYRLQGMDIVSLIKQYFRAHDVVRIADVNNSMRWVEVNKPLEIPTGRINPQTGLPETRFVFEEVRDPASGDVLKGENGELIMAPIPTGDTEIAFTDADITVESVSYNDEEEKNQVILDSFLNGPAGNMLSQMNPVGYFKVAGLAVKNLKSKFSPDIAAILEETAAMLQGNQGAQQAMMQGDVAGQMPQSQASNNMGGRPSQGGM